MDHAGLLSEFQNFGIECFLFDGQFEGIDEMERIILKNAEYRDYRKIDKMGFTRTTVQAFNRFCQEIKVFGQVIKTPGHSPDSITYITKDREALIGDLYPKNQIMPDDAASLASWALIESKGAQKAFPSHAAVFDLEATG
jgi:glyoxylase-like metal-dependent hydrolase (beta-lactamase superfamily II)